MKTLKLIDSYIKHYTENVDDEQDQPSQDATEPQPTQEVVPLSAEGEKYLVDLLVKAFSHTPSDEELKIVDDINQELGNINPKEVSSTIEKLLSNSKEDMINLLDTI